MRSINDDHNGCSVCAQGAGPGEVELGDRQPEREENMGKLAEWIKRARAAEAELAKWKAEQQQSGPAGKWGPDKLVTSPSGQTKRHRDAMSMMGLGGVGKKAAALDHWLIQGSRKVCHASGVRKDATKIETWATTARICRSKKYIK